MSTLPAVQARAASDFVDSVGVTTHLNYLETVYYTEWPRLRDLLLASGIRHVRDGIPRMAPWYYERLRQWTSQGVQLLGMLGAGTPDDLAALVAELPGGMPAIEGVNEWDLNGGANWAADLCAYQPKLYEAGTAHGLTVLGPSVTSWGAAEAVGDLSHCMDRGNLHNYYGTRHPETQGWGDDGYGSLDWAKRMAAMMAPGEVLWTVETGYPTAPGHPPAMPDRDMPEAACVRYLTRLLVEQFAQGIPRTYLYQFAEDFQPQGPVDAYATHGLVRADATPKATYHAVKNLIGRLQDAPLRAPGTLPYALTEVPDLRHVLLQKRDGTFYLLVWIGRPSMHPDTREMYPEAEVPVTLRLAPMYTILEVARLEDSGQIVPAGRTPELLVSDRLTLVTIRW